MLCSYGCGREGKYYSDRSKNWRCSLFSCQCPEIRKKNSNSNKGHIGWSIGLTKETNISLKKMSENLKGRKVWNKGYKNCYSEETLNKIRKHSREQTNRRGLFEKGNIPWNKNLSKRDNLVLEEMGKKISVKNTGRVQSIEERNKRRKPIHTLENKERLRQKCLNGHASYMNKFIKNPSNDEIKLRNIVKELYPNCEFQFKVFNYSLDIAIMEYKIAIEYDGWYHFDCKEHIDYHKNRQNKIESVGWKFIKYNIFQPFPLKEQIKSDIYKIIESEGSK